MGLVAERGVKIMGAKVRKKHPIRGAAIPVGALIRYMPYVLKYIIFGRLFKLCSMFRYNPFLLPLSPPRSLLLMLLLCLHTITTYSAWIKGRVTDENGQALGWASIAEVGTTRGALANEEGYYTLELAAGPREISCQVVGYQTLIRRIEVGQEEKKIDFKMSPQKLEMAEIIVHADSEDPAYPIMRKVIRQKQEHTARIKSLQTDIYLKGLLRTRSTPKSIMGIKLGKEDYEEMNKSAGLDSSGKGIVYLLEETSRYTFLAPDKHHTHVVSIRESGNPQGLGWATMPEIIDIYQNNVTILEGLNKRGFISPAHDNAFAHYRFQYSGSYTDNGKLIKKIRVIPKRKYAPLFKGYVYVVDGEWVFQSVDLSLDASSQLNLLDTLKLDQYFTTVGKGSWVIQNQVLYPVINLAGFEIAGHIATNYRNQVVNAPVDHSLFQKRILSTYDSTAQSRSAAYWDSIRPVPLARDEVRDFERKDSLYVVQKQKEDSLQTATEYKLGLDAWLLSGPSVRIAQHTFALSSIPSGIAYNTVEGINARLMLSWKYRISALKNLEMGVTNRYGFNNRHYNALFHTEYRLNHPSRPSRSWRLRLQGGQYVYQINGAEPISPLINELYTLLGGRNYMKIYENRFARGSVQRAWGNGLDLSAQLSYEQRMPLHNTTDYTLEEENRHRISSNQPAELPEFKQHTAFIIDLGARFQPGWRYIRYPKHTTALPGKAPVFAATYTKAIAGIGESTSNFDKWKLSVTGQFGLQLWGELQYNAIAGGFINQAEVGLPDWQHFNGNLTFLAGAYKSSFQLAPYYRYSNTADIYGQLHLEWHLLGAITNKIPGFRHLNWQLVAGVNSLYIDTKNYYTEVFIGLENIGVKIFRFGRVDFIAGYESGQSNPSLGIRLGLSSIFF